jgi:hypothetical protein
LPKPFDTQKKLPESCQYPLTFRNKFARGLLTIFDTFARGLGHNIQRASLLTPPLKKIKFKMKNQQAADTIENLSGVHI